MPNLVTHYTFAKEAEKLISGPPAKIIKAYPDAFSVGAMGPDVFFVFREIGGGPKMLANRMQYHYTREATEAAAKYIKESGDERALAYILGFMCHYALDRTGHAYINYFIEEVFPREFAGKYQSMLHGLTEVGIDVYMIREYLGISDWRGFDAGIAACASKATRISAAKLVTAAWMPLYGYKASEGQIRRAFVLSRMFAKFTNDPSGRKKAFFDRMEDRRGGKKQMSGLMRPPEGMDRVDFMNRSHLPWRTVRNRPEISAESFDELFQRSLKDAVYYMEALYSLVKENKPLDPSRYAVNYEGVYTK